MFLSNLPCHPKRPDVRDEGSSNGWDEGGSLSSFTSWGERVTQGGTWMDVGPNDV